MSGNIKSDQVSLIALFIQEAPQIGFHCPTGAGHVRVVAGQIRNGQTTSGPVNEINRWRVRDFTAISNPSGLMPPNPLHILDHLGTLVWQRWSPNPGLISPAIMGYSLQIIAGAGWLRRQSEAKERSSSPTKEVASATGRHAVMSWAQRLKRFVSLDIKVCGCCGGSVRAIACTEGQETIDRVHAHLRDRERDIPTLPLLTPPTRAPPETLPLFAGKRAR